MLFELPYLDPLHNFLVRRWRWEVRRDFGFEGRRRRHLAVGERCYILHMLVGDIVAEEVLGMSCMMVELYALELRIWARNLHIRTMLGGQVARQQRVEMSQHYKLAGEGGSREEVEREEMDEGCCSDLEVGDRT